jgi:methionyl-tRNA formyltransferase
MNKGAGLLVKTVKGIESGRYSQHPQDHFTEGVTLKHAPKIFKEDCLLDFNQPAEHVYNRIRGLSPSPTAYTTINDKVLKIYNATFEVTEPGVSAGAFVTDNKTRLRFATKDGFVSVTDVQLEGKKRMGIEEFLRGNKF